MTNPSTEAREAADKISANDDLVRGGWMPIGKFKAAEIIQSAIDSALSASAARVKLLEGLLRRSEGWLGPDHPYWDAKEPGTLEHLHEDICAALSIKVGETKDE